MLRKEKIIREAIESGKKIYEIPEANVFISTKPSKTEPGQALSIRSHIALAQAGVGSVGFSDDMFDFDEKTTVEEALQKTGMDLLPAGASSISDLINQRIAVLRNSLQKKIPESEKYRQEFEKHYKPKADKKDDAE